MLNDKWRNYPEYCYPCGCVNSCGDNILDETNSEKGITVSCKMDVRIDANEDSIEDLREQIDALRNDKRSYEGMNAKIDLRLQEIDRLTHLNKQLHKELKELDARTVYTFGIYEARLSKLEGPK